MKYNKRSRKPQSQKGGHAPCLDSVPSSCYKIIVNMHGAIKYEDRNTPSNINFPFASLKYYVPNGRVASFEPDYDLPSYLGDICNDRPELIIEEIPQDDTPGRLSTTIINMIAGKADINTTIEQEKSVEAGTMIDIGNHNAPNYGGIYLCTPAVAARGLAAFNEKAQVDEILSDTPRVINAPPNALRQREEKIRTRNEKYATPLESAIKLFSDRELVQIPNLYNSANGSVRQTSRTDDEVNKNLIKKLMLIEPVVNTQEMKWDAEDAEDAAKESADAAAAAMAATGTADAEKTAAAAEKAAEKAMRLANAAKIVKYKSFHFAKIGDDDVVYQIEHIIRIVKPQLEQRGINIANCELCIFTCRSWTPQQRPTGFKPDTAEAIAEDRLTGAPPTRFATHEDFMKERNRRDAVLSAKVSQMEKDEIGISKYTTNKAEKRRQNEEWLIRRALKLSPREDVPNRLQNVYTESVIRTDDPKNYSYRLQDDEYGKYTPTWNAEWANLKQRWYRNGKPYNPGTLANIAKGRELVLRKGTQLDNKSPAVLQQMRDVLISMQAREALNDKPYINVTPSQLYAYLTPRERPSIESVLEAVSDEEIKNYVIVDGQDNDATKLLVDIQTNSMDSVNDALCPSHEKIPQPCTTPENSYKKQSLVFYPDKNLKCPKAATKKFNYLTSLCKESGNTAGGSKKRKRRKTRRRINMRRRKTRRR